MFDVAGAGVDVMKIIDKTLKDAIIVMFWHHFTHHHKTTALKECLGLLWLLQGVQASVLAEVPLSCHCGVVAVAHVHSAMGG